MAKLILTIDGAVAGTHFIGAPRFTIGSLESSSLPLAMPGVSRTHAVITPVGNDDILEDLDSTNGTLVNGSKITRHILQHDDIIEIAGCQIRYRSQKAVSGPSLDRTMVIRGLAEDEGKAAQTSGIERAAARKTGQLASRLGVIKVIRGPQAGAEIELSRVLRTFGRAGAQVAVINRRPHGYFITHVEGRKTALLNGKAIGEKSLPLAPDDILKIGDEELQFLLR
jgi:hypothetical protein